MLIESDGLNRECQHVLVAGDNRSTSPGICSLGQRSTRVFVSHFGPFVDWLHGDALLSGRSAMKRLMLAVVLVVGSQMAYADYSGERLLELCQRDSTLPKVPTGVGETINEAHCLGYLLGLAAFHDKHVELMDVPRMYCLPEEAALPQWSREITKFMEANPRYLREDAAEVVLIAFNEAFPCE